jgi:hypothetical protein
LGEAYAFGVAWSFFMKALAVMVLRFTEPEVERLKVPLNIRFRGVDLPIGLAIITILLFLLAGINALTKATATIAGTIFTVVFFIAFSLSERVYKRNDEKANEQKESSPRNSEESETELFRLEVRDNLSPKSLDVRPGNILVAVHDPENLSHFAKVLEWNNPEQTDVIVISVSTDCADAESENLSNPEEIINACQTKVFSKVVYVAEKAGKPARLMAVPGKKIYELILLAANRLLSSRVVISLSETVGAEEQAWEITQAWERLPRSRPDLHVEILPG